VSLLGLLAAIALQHVHRVDGYCVAADRFAVVIHDCPIRTKF
jgi:hypothetical protein